MTTMPTRIDQDLFDSAKATGERLSRSAAQQISHWARLGRELEASTSITSRDIARVLADQGSYDSLSDQEQAAVRTVWDERIDEARASLDLAGDFEADADSWSELDDHGDVVVRDSRRGSDRHAR